MNSGMAVNTCINTYLKDAYGISKEYYLILNEANNLDKNETDAINKILLYGLEHSCSKEETEKMLDEKDFKSLMFGYTLLERDS